MLANGISIPFRHRIRVIEKLLHKGKPEKSLLKAGHLKKQGRGFGGRISVRHRGGGVKKRLRLIDFNRDKNEVTGVVKRLEYDPNRSAFIALVFYTDGEKRYILAPEGIKIGQKIVCSEKAEALCWFRFLCLSQVHGPLQQHCLF